MTHLKPSEMSHVGRLLEQRAQELREEIREVLLLSDDQHHKDLAGMVADAGDESVANMLTDLDTAIIDRHVHELRQIETARMRIAAGGYGICADCGGEIDYERLAVFPTATRCATCQGQHEKIYVHAGTPTL